MKIPKLRQMLKKTQGCAVDKTANKKCKLRIRVVGLSFDLAQWLEGKQEEISLLNHLISTWSRKDQMRTIEEEIKDSEGFLEEFEKKLDETGTSSNVVELIRNNLV
jgi:hypothetical protein